MDLLDSDPDLAWEEFYAFAWKLTRLRQPQALRSLPVEEREDVISDTVQSLQENDFRLLRTYENRGKPFAVWFWKVLMRRALDRLRYLSTRQYEQIPDGAVNRTPLPADEAASRAALEVVRATIERLTPRCRVMLLAVAEGYKPKDLLDFDSLPYDDNKKLGDQLKNCRRSLIKALAKQGYSVDDLLG